MKLFFVKILSLTMVGLLSAGSVSFLSAATPANPPERERQVTLLRKQVLEKLILDAERLEKIEAADLVEDKAKRQELSDGRYIIFFKLHDLSYRVEMSPEGKMISFGQPYEWWEIALAALGLVALGFAGGAAVSK